MNTYDILNAGPKNRFTVNGRVVSNSGRQIQLQNLVRNSLSTLDEARELVKMGAFDMLASIYGNVPDVLSQLCRTMLIPKPGHEFIVADFSAIEARILAWLAGEQWVLDAFARGEDIYCATASAMFGVPVVKHGENGELRQKGKIATLACVAAGQLVLTNHGGVPIERVTTDMRLWDGDNWVKHDGVIYKGEREVIEYEGLTATPDHLVYADRDKEPIPFGEIAGSDRTVGRVPVYDILNAGPKHRFIVSGKLVHNCGYQGGPGALAAMGALEMGLKEDELQGIIDSWRDANPNIVKFWWDLERAAIKAVKNHEESMVGRIGVEFSANTLWLVLPSGRKLAYIRPKTQPNKFGRDSVTYEGLNAANKWTRGETYGGKLAENCLAEGTLVATSRGAVPIEDVKKNDLIFDGFEFVRHGGLVANGVKPVIEIGGLEMTRDHKILTSQGWRQACEGGCWDDGDPIIVQNSHAEKPVFDVMNCGERHRFAVFDGDKMRIVSNCTQATARDLLAEAMWRMEQAGLDIVGHVHDEVVLETSMNTASVEDVCEIMNQNPSWAEGLPLASAGYKGKYYFKD